MKLFDYIEQNKDNITEDNIHCYLIKHNNKKVISFALYRKNDKIFMYKDCLSSICLSVNKKELAPYYQTLDIDIQKIKIIKRNQWSKFLKTSIINSVDKNTDFYKDIRKCIKEHGGQIIELFKGFRSILIGISSSDEDYYYVSVYKKDDEINFNFSSCCGSPDYINQEDYTQEDYELIDFVKSNKGTIYNKLREIESDVIITPIIMERNIQHYKHHKDTALDITLYHCCTLLNKSTKTNKSIDVLKDILLKLNDQQINTNVIKLLNAYITEYGNYYKSLDKCLKHYYKDFFNKKLNDIFVKYTQHISDEKVISYLNNICKCLNRAFNK